MQKKLVFRPQTVLLQNILATGRLSKKSLAQHLGTSYYTLTRWERGDIDAGAGVLQRLQRLLAQITNEGAAAVSGQEMQHVFASHGIRKAGAGEHETERMTLAPSPGPYLLSRLKRGAFWGNGEAAVTEMLFFNAEAAPTLAQAAAGGVSAGKNTYTYDAHTYHTKVPPQGIAQILQKYLPAGGLVLDPFAGSGMTGVAALASGCDVILNELSPAASFIADRFTSRCAPEKLAAAVQAVMQHLAPLRHTLYTTHCRQCGKETELLFTVWSYKVLCSHCRCEFTLWDECRSYGKTVREHKFLREFPCPFCGALLKKSRLERTSAVPVLVGYKCCGKRQCEVPPDAADLERIAALEASDLVAPGFVPDLCVPDGVNLSQPKRHGLQNFRDFYTPRNLAAMSRIWEAVHKVRDTDLAAFLGFVFTSLYQRVTRLSEYRFWGGSGNTANFNVPYIFNEANVFVTFERKARSVLDHLATTACSYNGRCVVHTGAAARLGFLPDESVDLIFTDPPFGANINYSEMNMLWEAWLGAYTETAQEAIVNRFQNKDAAAYQALMTQSLRECFRVLRAGHWLVLVFMNSAKEIWECIRSALLEAGFSIERMDIFDKQHGTFKQFVSDNTAGADLLLHCRKPAGAAFVQEVAQEDAAAIPVAEFLKRRSGNIPILPYLHVRRGDEIDYRTLYSEYLSEAFGQRAAMLGFAAFRAQAQAILERQGEV